MKKLLIILIVLGSTNLLAHCTREASDVHDDVILKSTLVDHDESNARYTYSKGDNGKVIVNISTSGRTGSGKGFLFKSSYEFNNSHDCSIIRYSSSFVKSSKDKESEWTTF